MRKPKHALWFSTDLPTEKQLEEIRKMGYYLVGIARGMKLARNRPRSVQQAMALTVRLSALASEFLATGIFGEFPPEVLHLFFIYYRKARTVLCFMPTTYPAGNGRWEHREFVVVGALPWLPRSTRDLTYRQKKAYVRRLTIWRRRWAKLRRKYDLSSEEETVDETGTSEGTETETLE
jgi:hypothetical protein